MGQHILSIGISDTVHMRHNRSFGVEHLHLLVDWDEATLVSRRADRTKIESSGERSPVGQNKQSKPREGKLIRLASEKNTKNTGPPFLRNKLNCEITHSIFFGMAKFNINDQALTSVTWT